MPCSGNQERMPSGQIEDPLAGIGLVTQRKAVDGALDKLASDVFF